MRTTATSRYRRAARMQRIPATLVKWTYLFLILLAITVNTSSGKLPIAKANPRLSCPPVTITGYTTPQVTTTDICQYYLNNNTDHCDSGYTEESTTPPSCVAGAIEGNSGGSVSFCISNPGAKYCQTNEPCAGNSTTNGCTVDTYCTAHPDDTASCPPSNSSNSGSFCFANPGAKYCIAGRDCAGNSTAPDCTVNGYCNAHPDDAQYCGILAAVAATIPPGACPAGFTSSSANSCQLIGGTNQQVIVPPCKPANFVNIGGTCYPNATVDLLDKSSGLCTLTGQGEEGGEEIIGGGEENGNKIYWCPYTGTTLTCNITGTTEECTMANALGYYDCAGLDASNDPQFCNYFGPNTTSDAGPTVASSTCFQLACAILSCFDTSKTPVLYDALGCTVPEDPKFMQLSINQRCTPQVGGAYLTCHYISTNGDSNKLERLSISCASIRPLNCTAAGPYGITFQKQCQPSTFDNANNEITCYITDANHSPSDPSTNPLWIEKCQDFSGGALPNCEVDNRNNVQIGTLQCSGTATALVCTTSDDNNNAMTVQCTSGNSSNTCYVDIVKPDCPHTDPEPAGTATAVTEATIACDGNMVADILMYQGPGSFLLDYSLSQAELEFELKALGIGSESWTSETDHSSLPKVQYV